MEHYYSFYIGLPGSPIDKWVLEDIKIPAVNVREALVLHSFHTVYMQYIRSPWMSNKDTFKEPDPWFIKHTYRRVLEFEKKPNPRYGKTLVQYKEIKKYSQHEILTYFKG